MLNILYHQNRILIAQTTANADTSPYGGFNMGLHTNDDPKQVLTHRSRLLSELNAHTSGQVQSIYWLNQIHSEHTDHPTPTLMPPSGDAWITTKQGVGLAIMTADCVPIVIFGERGAIACIHAGWQGLVKGVLKNTYQQLPKDDYQAVVGACIGGANYEVSHALGEQIVVACVANGLVGLDELALASAILLPHTAQDKCYLDIVALTKLQLSHLNIVNLSQSVPCSYDGAKQGQYYSHRFATHQAWQNTGRMAMIVVRY